MIKFTPRVAALRLTGLFRPGCLAVGWIALAFGLGFTGAALSQDWPSKPITFVVPFPAGGSNDVVARSAGEAVRARVGQTVVVDNKPGANGSLGVEAVLRAPKDQHTFLVASDSVSLLPLFRSTSWDLAKTFTPVTVLSVQPMVLVTGANSGLKSIKDVQAAARAKPNQVPYATSGQGSLQHLVGELFSSNMGIDLLHVPYKGGGQAVNDVISGQVSLGLLGAAAVLPHVKSGRMVALAVTTRQRSAMLPETPTLAESGAGEIDVPQWSALFALAGTQASTLARLKREVDEGLADPKVKQQFTGLGMEPWNVAPEAFAQRMLQDRERWAKLIRDRKIALD